MCLAISTGLHSSLTRLAINLERPRIWKSAFRITTSRYCQRHTTSSWRTEIHWAVFLNGQPPINILMRRTSVPRGAVNFLHPLPKTPKVISSDYRKSAGWNRNTGHMTRRSYRAIPSVWVRSDMGANKDHEPLPQINLALLFGEESNLPFYYRKLAGNIPDVKAVKNILADIVRDGEWSWAHSFHRRLALDY